MSLKFETKTVVKKKYINQRTIKKVIKKFIVDNYSNYYSKQFDLSVIEKRLKYGKNIDKYSYKRIVIRYSFSDEDIKKVFKSLLKSRFLIKNENGLYELNNKNPFVKTRVLWHRFIEFLKY